MEKQRDHPQSKEKQEFPKRLLNKIEANKVSDIRFKTMIIRMLKELNQNFRELQVSFKELMQTTPASERA